LYSGCTDQSHEHDALRGTAFHAFNVRQLHFDADFAMSQGVWNRYQSG
jgi:hypothetical protein